MILANCRHCGVDLISLVARDITLHQEEDGTFTHSFTCPECGQVNRKETGRRHANLLIYQGVVIVNAVVDNFVDNLADDDAIAAELERMARP